MRTNILTLDLFATRPRRFIRQYVLPFALVAVGVLKIWRKHSWLGGYHYEGFDAVLIGVGYISAGAICAAWYTFPRRTPKEEKFRQAILWVGFTAFTVSLAIPLFRNLVF